jgi:hypothetical protein
VTCGCLTVEGLPETIAAGQTAAVELQITPRAMGGHRQRAVVFTDGKDETKSLFQIEVSINARGIVTSLNTLELGNIIAGDQVERELQVSTYGYRQVRFVKCEADAPLVTSSFEGSPEETAYGDPQQAGEDVRFDQSVKVVLSDSAARGRQSCRLKIHLELNGKPQFVELPVNADILGTARCYPAHVVLSGTQMKAAKPSTSEVKVIGNPANPVDLSKTTLHCSESNIVAVIGAATKDKLTLEIGLRPSSEERKSVVRGVVVGKVEGEEIFRIPVLSVAR